MVDIVLQSGSLLRILESHSETVTALTWLPDNSGFISGAMDRKIILWDMHGKQRDTWGTTSTRVTDLAVTPDMRRVISLGMYYPSTPHHDGSATPPASITASTNTKENRMIIYDFASKRIETYVKSLNSSSRSTNISHRSLQLDGELTSVKVSADSHYAIINHSPDEILLWDFTLSRISRRFTGQRQRQHVLRSCFGGTDGNFVASGSEDGSVYVWHRDSGALLETLPGHGAGSVNAVAWNPRSPRMFASCSDDHTVRVWEAPSAPPPVQVGVLPDAEMTLDGLAKGKGRIWDTAENSTSAMASNFAGQI
jgi:WD40 repeat protein